MKNDIRDTFTRFRKALNEAEEQQGEWYNSKQNGVPYTQQDELLQSIMQTAKQQFGADFTDIKTPMYYYKDDGDVSFFCIIPSLSNARLQYRYKDPSGCGIFLWTNSNPKENIPLMLSDENIQKLSKINGVYKNWKQELSTSEDIRPMNLKKE